MSATFLIDGATAGAFDPATFVKVAAGETEGFNFGELMKNPMVSYGLTGAGVGGIASILRSLLGNPDPDVEGGMITRLIKALTMGGLAGAGIAGGAKLLGKDLPSPTKIIPGLTGGEEGGEADPTKGQDPSWQTSAGVGLTGAAGAGLLGLLARRRLSNKALSNVAARLTGHTGRGANLLAPKTNFLSKLRGDITGLSPRARGAMAYLRRHELKNTGMAGDIGEMIEKARKGELDRLTRGTFEGTMSKVTPKGALGTGAGLGILHQLIGRE